MVSGRQENSENAEKIKVDISSDCEKTNYVRDSKYDSECKGLNECYSVNPLIRCHICNQSEFDFGKRKVD